jgi:flagella basal body P-ring formation protein FlgA
MKFLPVLNSSRTHLFGSMLGGALLCASALTGTSAHADESRWVPEDRLSELVDPALLPTGANVDVKFIKADERIGSPKCPAALFANSSGNKMWGRTYVRVQCVGSDTAPFFLAWTSRCGHPCW